MLPVDYEAKMLQIGMASYLSEIGLTDYLQVAQFYKILDL